MLQYADSRTAAERAMEGEAGRGEVTVVLCRGETGRPKMEMRKKGLLGQIECAHPTGHCRGGGRKKELQKVWTQPLTFVRSRAWLGSLRACGAVVGPTKKKKTSKQCTVINSINFKVSHCYYSPTGVIRNSLFYYEAIHVQPC